ncbi:translational activator of cytochrome c oxidase 1 isoform X2 [Varanus komodoensis]|uniref:Translational activator of cytochrome c oxidase 1 n=2 Tax=Varanus komodoensis TaxID=61221 RepID=A0A8D2KUA8_VARKO|nr:translational activator of cytochrome c oxidase 1 isoform X2 [Varanus komodoensis]XP_044303968.1 translational activator of cytochrome c oxidase 1 isoform X2 [Varanus komodoensis]XP_044303969.1 translational activator of cytochrome c oxidase 1 isoform X2 [Varanus komodoensis]XP_044303970.1 translational activator of cytochrome c oxidase 1 isoform X2 [Varanus komodoensis]
MSVGCALARAHFLFRQHLLTLLDHPHCTIHASCAAFAGHNKWSKVKHVKGPKDATRAILFQKLTMLLRLAVKEGGPDPHLNSNLANVIEQCRSRNMPRSSIEAAINRKDKAKSFYHLYEARGPGGSSLLIEILTDNKNRTLQEIQHLLKKHGGLLANGARHNFEKKGVVAVSGEDKTGNLVVMDEAIRLAIEAGAEDVQEEEDEDEKAMLKFICAVPTLHEVREKLESVGLCCQSAGLEFIPTISAQLSDQEMEQAAKLLKALQECVDVVRVSDNIA